MAGHANPRRRANKATVAEKRARFFSLRLAGHSIRDIARITGSSPNTVQKYINLEVDSIVVPLREELRKVELERLDDLYRRAVEVLEREHVHISEGRVVRDLNPETGDKSTIVDDGPVLAAIDRALKIQDRRAKLLGLDAPTSVQAEVTQVAPEDIELRQLIAEAKARNALEEQRLKEQG